MPPQHLNKDQSIQFYLDLGFTLFPLNGKIPPAGLRWREVKYDPFFTAKNNFGVQLRDCDLVIDIDPRNGGDLSFRKLVDRLKCETVTFTVETGSGGKHIYLRKPSDVKIRKNFREYPGLDFISNGGYVVGSGCIHPDSDLPYVGAGVSIADAPAELVNFLTKQDVVLDKGTGKYDDNAQTVQRYIEYLADAPIATEGQAGDKTTFAVAAQGHDHGLSPSRTFELMSLHYNNRCEPPWSHEQLKTKVDNAYQYSASALGNRSPMAAGFTVWTDSQIEEKRSEIDKFLQQSKGGGYKHNLNNTAILFSKNFPVPDFHDLLGYNEFTHQIEFLRCPPWHSGEHYPKVWTDEECVLCKFYLSNRRKFEPTTPIMHEAALKAAKDFSFHPVKDYLKTLKWDGHKRCHTWLQDFMGARDDEYVRAVGLKFLVAAVKRIFEPGCKYDYVLTLEGRQGTQKSTAFEILAVKKEWYADPSMDLTHKDSIFLLFGKWIIELPEMETHHRAETKAMKAFLSRSTDRARMPYGRTTQDFPRASVFGGTINPDRDPDLGWMKDQENRRYWPVLVGEAQPPDLMALRRVVDQIWAEAYQLYVQKVPIFLEDAKILELAEKEQKKRLGKDPWHDSISRFLESEAKMFTHMFTGEEIYGDCLGGRMENYSVKEMARIARVMNTIGWEKGIFWDKEKQKSLRGYRRPMID